MGLGVAGFCNTGLGQRRQLDSAVGAGAGAVELWPGNLTVAGLGGRGGCWPPAAAPMVELRLRCPTVERSKASFFSELFPLSHVSIGKGLLRQPV
jgi:hypothetical protein